MLADNNLRPQPDKEFVDIAEYTANYTIAIV